MTNQESPGRVEQLNGAQIYFEGKRQSKHRVDINLSNGMLATTRPGSGGAVFQMPNRPVR